MILCNDTLRVALVTTHLPISKVPQAITKEEIVSKLEIFNKSLIRDFGINAPRIAVFALNPHAGDSGLLGTEEQEIIIPPSTKPASARYWHSAHTPLMASSAPDDL